MDTTSNLWFLIVLAVVVWLYVQYIYPRVIEPLRSIIGVILGIAFLIWILRLLGVAL